MDRSPTFTAREWCRTARSSRERAHDSGGADAGERALLRRIAAADREAFRQLYYKYYARLGRFLSRVIRNHDDAEEVIQDTLMIVWQHADNFRGTSRVSTWIFGIAYRRALNSLRKSAARSRVLVPELEGVEQQSRTSPARQKTGSCWISGSQACLQSSAWSSSWPTGSAIRAKRSPRSLTAPSIR